MSKAAAISRNDRPSVDVTIGEHAEQLSSQLQAMSEALFPPTSHKSLRKFTSGEAARLMKISDSTLRKMTLAGEGPQPELASNGRRFYTLGQINEIRQMLAGSTRGRESIDFVPHRRGSEHLQVIAVTNFKGGSGKTTTSAHLAQYLALQGYRVLAVDLDPQASLSALLGVLPETDVGANETLYAAIRYDETRRPLRDVIRPTYFDGLHLVPGNLELMEFEHTTPKALTDKGTRDGLFFTRVAQAFDEVADDYDVVVIDCPPQLGFLTLSGLCAATSMVITVHPQMLDIASMSQFLLMTRDLLGVVKEAGGNLQYDFIRYLLTRYEPQDAPQTKVAALLRNMFEDHVLTNPMVKSAAVSDAGLTKQTLYEIGRENLTRSTYDRAMESLDAVNSEIEALIKTAWGRA
ncbi:plasmid partitioning protein RepA [Agrobacterium rhizogenes]|uniref:Plasmid partitioning protein RepA n=7 Tax=Rhizobium/Agrobacterium group TaxID=227290 RepID=A0A2Z2PUG8_RHIRH|nr:MULTISPECIES: plasmid partitioning protein RepA [Rhizobium/Agrobacterium group]AYD04946.1 replication protein A [Neorhizobium sp. NCHU2750]MBO0133319.1 plasmid partitioning protein RepA [Agrobacterium burrii]OCJ08454.1 plasmid partitioning protein RepA [Agrobacterium sp. B131/95]OCJ28714.1 plasmid partitioning protein RepA [Agrobacterium sp. B133/95]ASK43756.1 plasmid partitioning protein RepA [Agrobacterium radiobacter]